VADTGTMRIKRAMNNFKNNVSRSFHISTTHSSLPGHIAGRRGRLDFRTFGQCSPYVTEDGRNAKINENKQKLADTHSDSFCRTDRRNGADFANIFYAKYRNVEIILAI
jgi:hypothetical protein